MLPFDKSYTGSYLFVIVPECIAVTVWLLVLPTGSGMVSFDRTPKCSSLTLFCISHRFHITSLTFVSAVTNATLEARVSVSV
jgi:hypothetical protein